MNKITTLAIIAIATLTLGMMTPDLDFVANAADNKKSDKESDKDQKTNRNNHDDDDDNDDCDDDDSRSSKYGDDDCNDDDHDNGAPNTPPTVTVYKVVINNQGNPSRTIGEFGVKLNNTAVTLNGTSFTLTQDKPVALTESGLVGYEFVEIRGDGHCPENLGGTITLDNEQNIECYIVNQPTGFGDSVSDPPTVRIFKVVLNHQGTFPTITDFGVTLNNVAITQNGTLAIPIPTNTPVTLNESGFTGYEFAEIRGDGHCPENLGGTITLSNGQDIECYIVNRPPSQTAPVEPGVIFHFNTLVLDAGDKRSDDSCSAMSKTLPCVELANVNETNSLLVVDSKLQTDTTIVLFSVVEADKINNGLPAESPLCVLSGMKQHVASYANNPVDSPVDQPTDALGFEVNCSLIEPLKYKFSYALIETNRGP
ncbi:MAG: hypothetical protein WAO91_07735 [Candidatus Nitrosotenuis sp.]